MRRMRRGLLLVLLLVLVGTSTDLLLLEHYEEWEQWLPLAANALALGALGWLGLGGGARAVRGLQGVMLACLVLGVLGVWFHFRGNLEFQLEIDPTQGRWELFRQVLRAKAPPVLAPGTMVQLGLIGLLFSYRHPALARGPEKP